MMGKGEQMKKYERLIPGKRVGLVGKPHVKVGLCYLSTYACVGVGDKPLLTGRCTGAYA